MSPPGLPEVALELWPEARGASPPGARAGWRDLAQIVTLGLAAALVVVFVAQLEPSPRAPEPRASIPAPGDRGDLSPVVWAMFYGSVIDPAADPRREPSARARGDRSRVGAGVAGDASPYEDWFRTQRPAAGEDDDSRAAVELPPTRAGGARRQRAR
ncbi:MAG: hypothetical protein H6713_37865 [Myxococcales bacterium]|nr:hypothetical protein [Myxococcales bacterium]